MYLVAFSLQVWITLLALCDCKTHLEIKTSSGVIRGVTVTSFGDKTVDAFLGIPYGASTTGQNRFAPPRKAEPWNDVFDASRFSQPCYQAVHKKDKSRGWWLSSNEESEDCLKLNVWIPKPRPQKTAVMVWIHGGAFTGGSTDIPNYHGAVLASQENVIVVSLNYRLSAFGFLFLDHPQAPGNVGLMDQTLGLQWVQENIKAFGGDPRKVTIFGQSAGAASVVFHLLSPTSLDLFQNAIVNSGSLNSPWATSKPDYAVQQALLLAERVGCPTEKDKANDIIRCLQEVSAEKLQEANAAINGGHLSMKFRPVIDGKHLKAHPSDLLSGNKICSSKNVLIGYTKDDGSFVIPSVTPHLTKMDASSYTSDDIKQLISSLTVLNKKVSGLPVELISLFYADWKSESSLVSPTFGDIVNHLTDRFFGCPSKSTAHKLAKNGNNVFFYRFDHVPPRRDSATPYLPWLGSAHADDVAHVLGNTLKEDYPGSPEEVKLTKQIMRYWANFAKTGDPNDEYLPTWPKYTVQNSSWLHLDTKGLTVGKVQRLRQCHFWDNIFPEIESAFEHLFEYT